MIGEDGTEEERQSHRAPNNSAPRRNESRRSTITETASAVNTKTVGHSGKLTAARPKIGDG